MKIFYIHQYYLTPEEGGAVRSYHLAKGFAAAGIEVEVFTGHNQEAYQVNHEGNVKIHRLPVPYDNLFGTTRRIYAFFSFVRKCKKLIASLPKPDLFYISSTPLSTGMIGLWAKKRWDIPFVFEVRDLWPEAPIQIMGIKNRLIIKILYRLESKIYREAAKIVALSPGIEDYISQRVPDKDIELVPNFADTQFFQPDLGVNSIRDFNKSPFTIAYIGAVGEVNHLFPFLSLAERAMALGKNWKFTIKGKGNLLDRLKAEKNKRNLTNVFFLPFGNRLSVKEVLNQSDLVYISFKPVQVLETSSPNKFFDALAAGRPVVVNFKGWIWDIIKNNGIGFFHQLEKQDALISFIQEMENQPEKIVQAGEKARWLAETYFSKEAAIKKLLDFLLVKQEMDSDLPGFVS